MVRKILLKTAKWLGIAVGAILLVLFLAPYVFPNLVGDQIKKWTNQTIRGELNFSVARLSFFHHFPSLTLTLYDFTLKGSAPFAKDTLVSADEISLGVNLGELIFQKKVHISQIFVEHADLNVQVSEDGEANYNIYQAPPKPALAAADTSETSLRLERISITNSRLVYNDRSIPMLIDAGRLYYDGSGNLDSSIFDLDSHIQTDSLSFALNGESYISRKAIDARLLTSVNTTRLALIFRRNDLLINKLKLAFAGRLDFLKNGYDMDFRVSTDRADLHDFVTALPPEYLTWLARTTVKGSTDLLMTLKGRYQAAEGEMPDLAATVKIRDGYISHEGAKVPASNLRADLALRLPQLDPDSTELRLDSLFFNVDQDFVRAEWRSKGIAEPDIHARADVSMNLDNLQKALGFEGMDTRGHLTGKLEADGAYRRSVVQKGLRIRDTVISSVPSFHADLVLHDGYIKYRRLPQPLRDIRVTLSARCPDHDYRHAVFAIDTLSAAALGNYLHASARVNAAPDLPLEGHVDADINLAEIGQFYPLDSLALSGKLVLKANAKGKYAPARHLFPRAHATVALSSGSVQTKYYPHPVSGIEVNAELNDPDGSLRALSAVIRPAKFLFEGKSMTVQASLRNFEDLLYDIRLRGDLDIGRIYQVFAVPGVNTSGLVHADCSFKGRQSDAMAKKIDRLDNEGTLRVSRLSVTQENFPRPFLIREGSFSFKQDKMWFDAFDARYGKSDFRLDGFLQNAINYVLAPGSTLTGNFNLASKLIDADEFAAFSGAGAAAPDSAKGSAGVVLLPSSLDLTLKASADRVLYNGLSIDSFAGGVTLRQSKLTLDQTAFSLAGCRVSMDGAYQGTSPLRAVFEYRLKAEDFDVQRAYREVKLFRDLATSAAKARGILSLDYSLKGRLNQRMAPVYPSLEGGGVLTVRKLGFHGLKLFNAVSSGTGKGELKDPDLSKIEVKSTIKNNLITIERFKFRTAGFRVRFEGQTSFDNRINFKMRIGLPPLGIIGIPLRVTGTSDNPAVRVGKSDNDPLSETEDPDPAGSR